MHSISELTWNICTWMLYKQTVLEGYSNPAATIKHYTTKQVSVMAGRCRGKRGGSTPHFSWPTCLQASSPARMALTRLLAGETQLLVHVASHWGMPI